MGYTHGTTVDSKTRICTKCNTEYPNTNEYFSYANKRIGRLNAVCKNCQAIINKEKRLKIIEQKFVANCTRRFYESIEGNGDSYSLAFYDIMEKPPKVSVVATSKTDSYQLKYNSDTISADIQNKLSGILEFSPDGGNGWENLNNRENVQ